GIKLVVIAAAVSPSFLDVLDSTLERTPDLPDWIRHIRLVRLAPEPETYLLDDHWTAAGHRAVAQALREAMQLAPGGGEPCGQLTAPARRRAPASAPPGRRDGRQATSDRRPEGIDLRRRAL